MVNATELKAEMVRKGYTQEALAAELNIAPATFSLKMSGKAVFTLKEAQEIVRILGIKKPGPIFFPGK